MRRAYEHKIATMQSRITGLIEELNDLRKHSRMSGHKQGKRSFALFSPRLSLLIDHLGRPTQKSPISYERTWRAC